LKHDAERILERKKESMLPCKAGQGSPPDRTGLEAQNTSYPALHRMEQSGWIRSEWKLTDTNRKAKYYRLTAAGQKELRKAEESFEQVVKGVSAVLRYAQG
jgi:DNA-binding MarR family transcriptional regulator